MSKRVKKPVTKKTVPRVRKGGKPLPPQPKEDFDIDADGPIGKEQRATASLYEHVEDMIAFHGRGAIVRKLTRIFNCSPTTVDRAIAKAKVAMTEVYQAGKEERLTRGIKQLEHLAKMAAKAGKFGASRASIMDKHRLIGDFKDQIDLGLNEPAAKQLAEAEELRKQALAALTKLSTRK